MKSRTDKFTRVPKQFRLPKYILHKLDLLSEEYESTQTAMVEAAINSYFDKHLDVQINRLTGRIDPDQPQKLPHQY